MLRTVFLWLALFCAAALTAAAQNFSLGLDYSAHIPTGPLTGIVAVTTAMDQQGVLYVLINGSTAGQPDGGTCYLVKLSTSGAVVYQTAFAFYASALAVDSSGNAYVADANQVAKIGPGGATVYHTTVGGAGLLVTAIALDNTGRLYVTGTVPAGYLKATPGAFEQFPPFAAGFRDAFVVRFKSSGAIDYATYLGVSMPVGIAVDPSGTAFVIGTSFTFPATPGAYRTGGTSLLARLSADGAGLLYATYLPGGAPCCVAVDSAANAVAALQDQSGLNSLVVRLNPQGTGAIFASVLSGMLLPAGLSVDGAGNTYATSGYVGHNYPPRNSLASCDASSSALAVLDGGGNVLQATYLPGLSADRPNTMSMSLGPGSAVVVVGLPAAGPAGGLLLLTHYSPQAQPSAAQLACVGNAANYASATDKGIAGGEMVALFGQGLGPGAGAQPQVTVQSGFPTELAGVRVTFNGIPAPLLYAQDAQINAIAPWALQTGQPVEICVHYNGAATNCIARTVVDADPGVFMSDATHAYALNQDGTVNSASNPAPSGSIVTILATGLGAISPPQPDGSIVGFPLPANVLPVALYSPAPPLPSAPFNPGIAETVEYAGPAPFEVAGVSQINFVPIQSNSTLLAGQGSCPVILYVQ